jgi:hypothetical protein
MRELLLAASAAAASAIAPEGKREGKQAQKASSNAQIAGAMVSGFNQARFPDSMIVAMNTTMMVAPTIRTRLHGASSSQGARSSAMWLPPNSMA